jgi:hypothetical protein
MTSAIKVNYRALSKNHRVDLSGRWIDLGSFCSKMGTEDSKSV